MAVLKTSSSSALQDGKNVHIFMGELRKVSQGVFLKNRSWDKLTLLDGKLLHDMITLKETNTLWKKKNLLFNFSSKTLFWHKN